MNHSSERASPGGSSALSRHCSSRWVLVNVPAFSRCDAAGIRKTSVWMSSVRSSPDWISGPSRQNVAVSISARSRTTSHFISASARRCSPECCEPAAGFCPITNIPSSPPSSARSIVAKCEWLPEIFGSLLEAVVVVRGRRVAEPGLEERDDVLVEVRPPAAARPARVDVLLERQPFLAGARHLQVAGQQVVERRDVGRALDRRVAAQGQDAAARPADVAEQQLQDRRRADHLRARGVLGPADGVTERGRALAAGVAGSARRRLRGSPPGEMPQTSSTISGV